MADSPRVMVLDARPTNRHKEARSSGRESAAWMAILGGGGRGCAIIRAEEGDDDDVEVAYSRPLRRRCRS